MAQEWIVVAIVAVAAAYLAWKWMPARWRGRLGAVHPALAESSGCGGCSSCGSGAAGGCATTGAGGDAARPVSIVRPGPSGAPRN
ncbi:hypothetical protein [Paracidovorax anthurii]|uniref:Uncharacterized protein n=1 Tax=Paracidovorax anthurii TaxID=78229 RepID=A0A328ZFE9_9BURK|nr:hypothetical protein [Paracidovorax anthurii]RAR84781.1 hypothetical protein AX018_100913 [Paracidovorax anthurii]WCM92244.1 hypothetical protein M5C99_18060 [Acidovorax sp. NCPPB 2350]